MHRSVHLSIHVSFCPSIHATFCLSIHLYSHLSIYLSIHPLFRPSVHPFIHPSIHPQFICHSVHPSILPSFCPSIHLSIYLSIYPSIVLSIHSFIHPSTDPSFCQSIYLSIHPLFCSSSHHPFIHPPTHKKVEKCSNASIIPMGSVYVISLADETVIWLTFTVSVVLAELKSRSALTGDASFGCLSANVCTAMIFIHAGGHFFSSIKTHCRTKKEENMHPCWIKVWISFLKNITDPKLLNSRAYAYKKRNTFWLAQNFHSEKRQKNLDILNFCHFWLGNI